MKHSRVKCDSCGSGYEYYRSALFWRGLPRLVFDKALAREYTMLATEELIFELEDVLSRSKFTDQLTNRNLTANGIVSSYRTEAVIILPAEVPPEIVRDPKDRMLLACAAGGKADCIVSGDKDLLVLSTYQDIPIMTAEQFLQRLTETDV